MQPLLRISTLWGRKLIKNTINMSKILTVIEPFFVMEIGDTFEVTEDGNYYTSTCNLEHSEVDDNKNSICSKYSSNYTISKDYAKMLIKEGYLEEAFAEDRAEKSNFVNVFDEITTLLKNYSNELDNLDVDYKNQPACMKVEKETVLRNMIQLLNHLNSLKK